MLETSRLCVRRATTGDIDHYLSLWTSPEVMRYVGFPDGLPITRDQIRAKIVKGNDASLFDCRLVVALKANGRPIGECKMDRPDAAGISETDVKLLPEYWGHGYGKEVKQALVNYLFAHTDCVAVQATPNVNNIASIKMQEAVGGVQVGEGVTEFPKSMRKYTTPVHYYIYHIYRPGFPLPKK